ncbi:hypothetical protein GW17_00040198 [Ensete ventricosum]|nr:hypothetical protein GW17_00040198 [Ensete ventricosum]RZS29317.1 hypothetical protein BHM03_00063028 [Ensete ventricosum]
MPLWVPPVRALPMPASTAPVGGNHTRGLLSLWLGRERLPLASSHYRNLAVAWLRAGRGRLPDRTLAGLGPTQLSSN